MRAERERDFLCLVSVVHFVLTAHVRMCRVGAMQTQEVRARVQKVLPRSSSREAVCGCVEEGQGTQGQRVNACVYL